MKKYNKNYHLDVKPTMAKCGHLSLKRRYFKCEECQPDLASVDETYLYCGDENDSEEEETVPACTDILDFEELYLGE